jgi:hypothetical protein
VMMIWAINNVRIICKGVIFLFSFFYPLELSQKDVFSKLLLDCYRIDSCFV